MSRSNWLRWRRVAPLGSPSGRAVFAFVALVGLVLWGEFFEWGRLRFSAFDWPKEHAYFSVLREALVEQRLPLHTQPGFQGTARFLANPEVPISPQAILLRWLPVPRFIVANWLILYSCGAIGTFLLARRLRLHLLPALFLLIVFGFNGHIVAHVSVGHSMWSGYFLFPFFAVALLQLLDERKTSSTASVALAVALTACLAQGAFHMTAWLVGFAALAAIVHRGARKAMAGSLTLFVLLGAHRIVPAVFAFSELRRPANPGYPSLEVLAQSLMSIRDWNAPAIADVGWWEYDVYLGSIATAMVLLFSALAVKNDSRHRLLLIPIGFVLALSMGGTFQPIADLPLPFVNSERGPTRFLIVPVYFLAVLAAVGLSRKALLVRSELTSAAIACAAVGVSLQLHRHLEVWRLAAVEAGSPRQGLQYARIVAVDDPEYIEALAAGWALTAATVVALAAAAWVRARRVRVSATVGLAPRG